ncbi:MAG: hypothetical protein Q9221_004753 [Calogaya cf. arnoldii]
MSPSHGPVHLPHFQGTVLSEKDNLLVVDQSSTTFMDVVTVVESRVSRTLPLWFDVLCVVALRMSLSVVFTNFIWINANGYTNLRRRLRQNILSEPRYQEYLRRIQALNLRWAELRDKRELVNTLAEEKGIPSTAVSEERRRILKLEQTAVPKLENMEEEWEKLGLDDIIPGIERYLAVSEDQERRLETWIRCDACACCLRAKSQ